MITNKQSLNKEELFSWLDIFLNPNNENFMKIRESGKTIELSICDDEYEVIEYDE